MNSNPVMKWKPGQSGNVSGKAGIAKLKQRLEETGPLHAAEVDRGDPAGRTRLQIVLDTLYNAAKDPKNIAHVRAGEEYISRAIGKPVTPMTVEGTVTHQTAEKHVENILQLLEAAKTPKPTEPDVNTRVQ